jgi:hypothetical protein
MSLGLSVEELFDIGAKALAVDGPIEQAVPQVLRIWLWHSCWPPPSQQIESKSARFGNPTSIQAKNSPL